MPEKINLAVLISGSGRTLQNFIDKINSGEINAVIQIVISSNPKAYGLVRARECSIKAEVVNPCDYDGTERFSAAINARLKELPVDLILLAGFSHFYKIPEMYACKVMNIHPGLIPAFSGKGYYGHFVHEAAIRYGVKISGCTVHFADNKYDNGPIIVQRTVAVMENDTPDTLAEKVFMEECIAYPEAVRLFAEGKLRLEGRKVIIGEKV